MVLLGLPGSIWRPWKVAIWKSQKYEIGIIDPSNTKLTVRMDPIDLECIFANLYLNSIESLAQDKKNAKRTVSVETKWDSSGLTIDFRDNGIGILAEEKDKMTELTTVKF